MFSRSCNSDNEARPRAEPVDTPRNILGTKFNLVSYEDVLTTIAGWREDGERHYITITPPHTVLLCHRDLKLKRATDRAALTLPDGVGIILAAKLLRYPNRGRVSGPTLMPRLCDWGRMHGLRHFFYGGLPGVGETLRDRLIDRFPGLRVVGIYCPPFRELTAVEDAAVVRQINDCQPDVVWVGLGSPKQEKWMAQHVERVQAAALIGVGAAFDFHSGRVKWAPQWMRKAGIEWAYRLSKEPGRMWRRNVNSVVFMAKTLKQCLETDVGSQTISAPRE